MSTQRASRPAAVESGQESPWQRELGEWVTRVLRRHYAEQAAKDREAA